MHWRTHAESNILMISSGGDVIFPSISINNIFLSRGKVEAGWNFSSIVSALLEICYSVGSLEVFANFNLAEDLAHYQGASTSPFDIARLFHVDEEVKELTILHEIDMYSSPKEVKSPYWFRHMWSPGSPVLNYKSLATQEIDVDDAVFDKEFEDSIFFDTETGKREDFDSEEDLVFYDIPSEIVKPNNTPSNDKIRKEDIKISLGEKCYRISFATMILAFLLSIF